MLRLRHKLTKARKCRVTADTVLNAHDFREGREGKSVTPVLVSGL